MSVFGFDSAVTSLGHFGTGFSRTFGTPVPDITNEDLLECCRKNTAAIIANNICCKRLHKEFQGMKADLRLLIAAVERMKKGRL